MSGRIIPDPFAIPLMVTGVPSMSRLRAHALATVSVVMIAAAASFHASSASFPGKRSIAAAILSIGRSWPMTPVENGSTSCSAQPMAPASRRQHCSASRRPCPPVPAFALPELINSACGLLAARCRFATVTGAAQNALRVNTPAQTEPAAKRISTRSGLSPRLMPAMVAAS